MLDPSSTMLLPQPSPTNSSPSSSSDFDNQSTDSFFHDQSTTLGTLLGVTLRTITMRAPSHRRGRSFQSSVSDHNSDNKKRKCSEAAVPEKRSRGRRGWRWWCLCGKGSLKPASLGEFLETERKFRQGEALFVGRKILCSVTIDGVLSLANGCLCQLPVSLPGLFNGCF